MNTVSIFKFGQKQNVRVSQVNNEPYFCLTDVTEALNIKNANASRFNLSKDGIHKMYSVDSLNRKNEINFINEPNLYRVIFRSNKKEAVEFQNWIFEEVLPQIRKTGQYHQTKPVMAFEQLNHADMANLAQFVAATSNDLRFKNKWNRAIWFAIRTATGTPSPRPFDVRHKKIIIDECERILNIINGLRFFTNKLEMDVLKRVVKNREELNFIIDEITDEFNHTLKMNNQKTIKCLDAFHRLELDAFIGKYKS